MRLLPILIFECLWKEGAIARPVGRPPTVTEMWTPTPDEGLTSGLQAALARPGASYVNPPRPVALVGRQKVTGWLWGRMRTADGTWLGLATLYRGTLFDGAELGWHPARELHTLD